MVVVLTVSAAPASQKEKAVKMVLDCANVYLRGIDELDKSYKYHPSVESDEVCEELLEAFQEGILEGAKIMIEEDDELKEHADCIMEKVKAFNILLPYMQSATYQKDTTLSKFKRQKLFHEANGVLNQKFELAQEICDPEKSFGDWFEENYSEEEVSVTSTTENTSESEATTEISKNEVDIGQLELDYCESKNLVEQGIIDTKVYAIEINPKNVDVSDGKCHKLWFQATEELNISLKDEFETGLNRPSPKEVRCMADTIREEKYAQHLMKVTKLSEHKITPEQKASEKAAFVVYMTNLYNKVLKCQES